MGIGDPHGGGSMDPPEVWRPTRPPASLTPERLSTHAAVGWRLFERWGSGDTNRNWANRKTGVRLASTPLLEYRCPPWGAGMRWWFAVLGMGVLSVAWARPKRDEAADAVKAATERGPAASAAEIPALANLLAKAGWTPTPELSGVFRAGSIFETTAIGHRSLADNCIAAAPRESTYTAAELVTSLQAGVAVGRGEAEIHTMIPDRPRAKKSDKAADTV